MPSIIQHDVERQPVVSLHTSSHVAENMPDFRDRAGQGCFLCLESYRDGQYAVLVPCLRPTKARQVKGQSDVFSDNPRPIYEKMIPWDSVCESDSDIYQRLTDTCYQHLAPWKRWLPYYGITEVLEVNVRLNPSCGWTVLTLTVVSLCWCCRIGWALSYPDGIS